MLQHLYWSVYFQTCAPGVVTAVLLVAPVILGLTVRAVRERLIPLWFAVLTYATVLPTLVATWRAGNSMAVLQWPVN